MTNPNAEKPFSELSPSEIQQFRKGYVHGFFDAIDDIEKYSDHIENLQQWRFFTSNLVVIPPPRLPKEKQMTKQNLTPVKKDDSKYVREIYSRSMSSSVHADIYNVLEAFGVTCPALQHTIKKVLCPGTRGNKDTLQDLEEAKVSIQRAIELEKQRLLKAMDEV